MLGGRLVGRVELAVVHAAALEGPELGVRDVLDHLGDARVAAEEVLAQEAHVLAAVGLVVAVRGVVHQGDQRAVDVTGEQLVPATTPDHLDDVPARAAVHRLELLDDVAVAAHRTVEALQVAVDHEDQVVQALPGGQRDVAQGLRLVVLAVAEERPDALLAGVLDPAVEQVAVEPRLVDRVERAEAHRHRRELPELRHEPGVGVAGQAAGGVRELLAEAVELVLAQHPSRNARA